MPLEAPISGAVFNLLRTRWYRAFFQYIFEVGFHARRQVNESVIYMLASGSTRTKILPVRFDTEYESVPKLLLVDAKHQL